MRVAFGLRAHSGWAALVVLGEQRDELIVIDRRRIDLVEELWAKQPYHAAETLESKAAHDLVKRGIEAAQRIALRELKVALKRERNRKNEVAGCAVVVGTPMPEWSTADILAVHFRMHKAEGALFQNALVWAADKCRLQTLRVLEKELISGDGRIGGLGKSIGPPWGKDQKDAALAALMMMTARARNSR